MRAENIHRLRESATAADISAVVAYTAASAAMSSGIPSPITEVRVVCSSNAWITFGASPTASAGAGSIFMAAGQAEYFRVTPGQKIAAIRDSADGNMSVGFMTR